MKPGLLFISALFVIVALASPSLWGFYLWTQFPGSAFERVQSFQTKYGIAQGCRSTHIDIAPPNTDDVKACFSSASEEQVILDNERIGEESITRTYRCDGNGFSGEIIYIFYSTSERYICTYKIAKSWEDIPQYKTGDIAGFPHEPSYLTKLLIRIFR